MNYKKHIKNKLTYSAFGTIGLLIASSISGCDNSRFEKEEVKNAFFVLQQLPDGSYEVIERHPTTGPSRAILRLQDGSEKFLSNEELTKIVQEDAQKMQQQDMQQRGSSMSMGEAIMAAAGGAILGNLIGSALANKMGNNQRFQSLQRTQMNKPGFNRSVNPSSKATSSTAKRGFFGRKSGVRSFGGFGG